MLLMYIPSYKGLLYAVIFDEMSVLTNSRLMRQKYPYTSVSF